MKENIEKYYFELAKIGFKSYQSKGYLFIRKGVKFLMEPPVRLNEKYIAMHYSFISTNKQKEVSGYIYLNDMESFQQALKRAMERFDYYEQKQHVSHQESLQKIYILNDVC